VLYYWQRVTPDDKRHVEHWTQQLIEASLSLGGTYYLPYQLSATRAQFARAYPNSRQYFALKARIDPRNQFSNKLLEKYRWLSP
jgi:FAD/FMN-containing dehydrogenase